MLSNTAMGYQHGKKVNKDKSFFLFKHFIYKIEYKKIVNQEINLEVHLLNFISF